MILRHYNAGLKDDIKHVCDPNSVTEEDLGLSDVTLWDVSIARHGLCPKAPNDTTKFLRGDAAWAVVPAQTLTVGAASFNPPDSTTRYFGCHFSEAPSGVVANYGAIYPLFAGTIVAVYVRWQGSAPSNEAISMYVRKNNTTDTLIASVGDTNERKTFRNLALSIALTTSDYFVIKVVCPAWTTNPTNVVLGGYVVMTT